VGSFLNSLNPKLCSAQAKVAGGGEAMYDQRLFNQEGGMGHGLVSEDAYNLYDKPMFADRGTGQHRAKAAADDEDGGGGDTQTGRVQAPPGWKALLACGDRAQGPALRQRCRADMKAGCGRSFWCLGHMHLFRACEEPGVDLGHTAVRALPLILSACGCGRITETEPNGARQRGCVFCAGNDEAASHFCPSKGFQDVCCSSTAQKQFQLAGTDAITALPQATTRTRGVSAPTRASRAWTIPQRRRLRAMASRCSSSWTPPRPTPSASTSSSPTCVLCV